MYICIYIYVYIYTYSFLYTHVYLNAMHWARGRDEVFEVFRGMSQDIDAEEKPFSFEVDVLKSQVAPNFTTLHDNRADFCKNLLLVYWYVTAHHSLDTTIIQKTTARNSQPANHLIPHFTTIVMSCANIYYGLATIRRLLKSIGLFTEYILFYRAFWRPIILSSLLIVATPYYCIAWQLIKFLTEHITNTKVGSILFLLRRTTIELTFENIDCPSNPSCSKSQHMRTKNCMYNMYVCRLYDNIADFWDYSLLITSFMKHITACVLQKLHAYYVHVLHHTTADFWESSQLIATFMKPITIQPNHNTCARKTAWRICMYLYYMTIQLTF